MSLTLQDAARIVGGALHGDGAIAVRAAQPIDEAAAGSITFATDLKHHAKLRSSAASAVLLKTGLPAAAIPYIEVADPLSAILQIAAALAPPLEPPTKGVHPSAVVDPTARLGADVSVGPFAVIEARAVLGDRCVVRSHAVVGQGSILGERVEIHPHAVLYPGTVVADRVIVHAGAVLGADGFGYQFKGNKYQKIPQLGRLEIASDVEIGANATIDRATLGATRVGEGTKVDNLVMIAHNCQIGPHNILASQTGLAGSCITEEFVTMAGQVGVADHVRIGKRAVLGAKSGIHTDVPEGAAYLGSPAGPVKARWRSWAIVDRLPEMRAELLEIRRRLGMHRLSGDATKADDAPPSRAAG